jgi:alkylation response protein AidB-like acyl-CoA dehydrogenase
MFRLRPPLPKNPHPHPPAMSQTTLEPPVKSSTKEKDPESVIDMSKMNEGQRAAMELTEAARESFDKTSFVADLFMGRWTPHKIAKRLKPDPEKRREEEAFLAKLRDFLANQVDPDLIDRTGEVPDEVMKGLADLGAYGIKVPKAYGGLGLSQSAYCRASEILGSRDGNLFAMLSVHQSVGVPQPLLLFGTEEQKKKYLPRVAGGELSAFALTEQAVGSDPARMITHAEPTEDGKHFILNGEKLWCSNGLKAGVMVVAAKTPPKMVKGKPRNQITAFIVDTSSPGVEIGERCRFMGLKALYNGVIRFKDVVVPRENIIDAEGKGLKIALTTLNSGRLSIPAACVGASKRCLQIAREWCTDRIQWGVPIGKHAAIAERVARIASRTFAMESMVMLTARLVDLDKKADIRLEAAITKMWGTEKYWANIDDLMQIRSGRGYETADSLRARGEKPYPVERMMRDARINTIFEGSSEIMRLFIMREALDPHLKVAGAALNSQVAWGERIKTALGAGVFYSKWYPALYFPSGDGLSNLHPRLAAAMQYGSKTARRLARTLFHRMAIEGPALEKRQPLLGRLADIGADLFALAASCIRAQELIDEGQDQAPLLDLVDQIAAEARMRISESFNAVGKNADKSGYQLAQDILENRYSWMEEGLV